MSAPFTERFKNDGERKQHGRSPMLIFTLYRENKVLRMISIHSEKLVEMPPGRLSLLSSQASSPMLEGQMSMP
jgi:hypothetical protein